MSRFLRKVAHALKNSQGAQQVLLKVKFMEENSKEEFFSKETCNRLLAQYSCDHSEQSLRLIIGEVSKLQPCMACETFMQELMIDLLIAFSKTRNDIVDERLINFLKGFKWFDQTFGSEELSMRKFIKNFEVLKLERYSKIVRKGETSDHFFLLVNGRASILKEIEPDKQANKPPLDKSARRNISFTNQLPDPLYWKEVHELADGDVFGDIGILYKRRRMATIVTKTKCTLIRIPADTFIQISAQSTLKQHQRRLKFICERLSPRFKTLTYDQLQHTVLQFEPCSYSYGSSMYRSTGCSDFIIIEDGQALSCHYKSEGSRKRLEKRQLLCQGRLIGVKQLITELALDVLDMNTPQYEPYLQKILQSNQQLKQHSSDHEQIVAHTAQVSAYKVSKTFLLGLLKNHRDILCDVLDHTENGLVIEDRPSRPVFKTTSNISKPIEPEPCRTADNYKKMQKFIVRKRQELRTRDKENARE